MATATNIIATTIRRPTKVVSEIFRRGVLHSPTPLSAAALSHPSRLVVLFTWIGAKDHSTYKYVDAWKRRGFQVLHVSSTVMDLVRPYSGCEVTGSYVTDYLINKEQKDFKVIIHGLSVGGYLGQKVLMNLQHTDTQKNISHQIYDSFTYIDCFESGVENAVHPLFKKVVGSAIRLYTKMADLSCLYEAAHFLETARTPSPVFFIHSLADKVAKYDSIRRTMPLIAKGNLVFTLEFPESEMVRHVGIFRHMGESSYMSSIIRFLKQNSFPALDNGILHEEDPDSTMAKIYHSRVQQIPPL